MKDKFTKQLRTGVGFEPENPRDYQDEKKRVILADSNTGIVLESGKGTTISGPLSLKTDVENIRVNSLWAVNVATLSTLPSTLYTPIPLFTLSDSQMKDMLKETTKVVQELVALVAIIGG